MVSEVRTSLLAPLEEQARDLLLAPTLNPPGAHLARAAAAVAVAPYLVARRAVVVPYLAGLRRLVVLD